MPQEIVLNKSTSGVITLRLTDETLLNEIDQRVTADDPNRSAVIREHLARYYDILRRGRATLRATLTNDEALCLVDLCNGTLFEAWSIHLLYANMEDSLEMGEGYDTKHNVDGQALLAKVKSLDISATSALVDTIERFWHGTQKPPMEALLSEPARRDNLTS